MTEWDFVAGLRGLRLRICEWGGGERVVVILHGWLEQAAAWDVVARELPGRIVAPDHRGHGLSDHVGPGGFYHFWDYVSDLDALVEHLGAPVDVVGHSMGGTIGSVYAGLRPENVRRLALVEGIGPPDPDADPMARARKFLADQREPPSGRILADVEEGVARMRKHNPSISPEVARALVVRGTKPAIGGGITWSWDPLHLARSPIPSVLPLYYEVLRQIRASVLLVYGGASPYRPRDVAQREACLAGAGKVVIEEAGHLVHHDAPARLAAELRSFLGDAT